MDDAVDAFKKALAADPISPKLTFKWESASLQKQRQVLQPLKHWNRDITIGKKPDQSV